MATATYLAGTQFKVGVNEAGSVDLTDQVKSITLTRAYDSLDATSMGDSAHRDVAGLESNQCVVTLLMSYAASETYATISGLVGTQCWVEATPAAGANTATNPGFQLDGTFLASFDVVNSTVAELSEVQLTFTNGNYTAVTS